MTVILLLPTQEGVLVVADILGASGGANVSEGIYFRPRKIRVHAGREALFWTGSGELVNLSIVQTSLRVSRTLYKSTADVRVSKYRTARNTIYGIETMNMIRMGQVVGAAKGDIAGQIKFINDILHSAA